MIRHAGAAGDKPAVDASGVVNTLELPMAELPALTSPPLAWVQFQRIVERRHRETVAGWQADTRQRLSDHIRQHLHGATANDAAEEPGGSRAPTGYTAPHKYFTWEEVLRQSLHGNVHLRPGSVWSGRQGKQAEARTLRWTGAGIRAVAHLLIKTTHDRALRLMTADEAQECLGVPPLEYIALLDAMPDGWKNAIEEGPSTPLATGHVVSTRATPHLLAQVLTPSPGPGRPTVAQVLTWQGVTARIVPTGRLVNLPAAIPPMPVEALDAEPEAYHVRMRSRAPLLTDEQRAAHEADPLSYEALNAAAAAYLWREALALPGQPGGEDTYMLGYVRRTTVRLARLVALASAKTKTLANLLASEVWQPIRTVDARQSRAVFYPWIERLRPPTQRLVVARWITQTQQAWLPGRARDAYARRLNSGYARGPEKKKGGWEMCPRCRQAIGLAQCTAAQHEDILHACQTCPQPGGAADVMTVLCDNWKRVTREELRPTGPLALFGDRRYGRLEEEEERHRHLEEPWRALHACVVVALECARRQASPRGSKESGPIDEAKMPKVWSLAKVLAKARREFCKLASRLATTAKMISKFDDFHRIWVRSGIVAINKRSYTTTLLDTDTAPPLSGAKTVLLIATDGSGTKDGVGGWGYTMQRVKKGEESSAASRSHSTAVTEECGRVVTDTSQPEYLGATRGTNYTAEITAVEKSLRRAAVLTRPRTEEVLLLAALGSR